jgi:hypothetical protein
MSQFFQHRPARRAPRANLHGSIMAVIRLENGRQLSGKLQQLSITGGLLDISNYVEERSWVDVAIYLSTGQVRATAEMMFPMRGGAGYLQPFRFTSLGTDELHAIDREVTELIKQSVAATTGQGLIGRSPRFYLESW